MICDYVLTVWKGDYVKDVIHRFDLIFLAFDDKLILQYIDFVSR